MLYSQQIHLRLFCWCSVFVPATARWEWCCCDMVAAGYFHQCFRIFAAKILFIWMAVTLFKPCYTQYHRCCLRERTLGWEHCEANGCESHYISKGYECRMCKNNHRDTIRNSLVQYYIIRWEKLKLFYITHHTKWINSHESAMYCV